MLILPFVVGAANALTSARALFFRRHERPPFADLHVEVDR
jgi:hypothetical protein